MTNDIAGRRPLSLVICLMTPVVILLLGVIASLAIILKASPELKFENGRGVVPPGFEVNLPEPGNYVLWWMPQAGKEEAGGKADDREDSEESLPDGARVMVFRSGSTQVLEVERMLDGQRSFSGEDARSLGTFSTPRSMDVLVKATGISDPVTIAVAPMKVGKMLSVAFSVGVVMVVAVLASVVALFALLHRRKAVIDGSAGVHSHPPAGLGDGEE